MPSPSWTAAEPTLPALTYTYNFGPGTANALALVVEGGIVLVSPPCNIPESAFTDLEKHGPLKALVAPNAFHSMGLSPWKARYPEVPVFAPAQSIKRLEKLSKVTGILPLAGVAELLGGRVEMVDMPHYKTGEALVRWKAGERWAWYMTDVAFNLPELPKGIFGTIMKWTKSAPGFRRNALASWFMIKDRSALYPWILEQAEKTPPGLLVMCHGDHVELSDPPAGVRAAFS